MPIAPMIDCVFLMLVYFMTTSSLERSEADLPCPVVGQGAAVAMPLEAIDEQFVLLDATGRANWNGSQFIMDDWTGVDALADRLHRFGAACEAAGSKPRLVITPAPDTLHQTLIRTLDTVSRSGLAEYEIR